MTRALATMCLTVLLCGGGVAWASKPRIAVLGLEVAPGPGGVVDPAMTQLAKDLTRELRQRAQSEASRYGLAPNSSKELTDEKLLMSCDDEATTCMAAIGAGLSADALMYGRLERRGDGHRISLKLLDVKAKAVEAASEDMPAGTPVASVARKIYTKLVGDVPAAASGTLVVRARPRSGGALGDARVMIDEQPRGALTGGALTVSGLAEGAHTVAIETGGRYERFEDRVTIRGGGSAVVEAVLVDRAAGPAPKRSAVWKVSLGAGIAIAAAGGGFAYYSYDQMQKNKDQIAPISAAGGAGATVGPEDCGTAEGALLGDKNLESLNFAAFERTCSWHSRIYVGYAIAGVGALGAIVSLIMISRDPPPAEQSASGMRKRDRKSVALVPVLTGDRAGASLSLSW
jgi:hypothetical protein